MIPAENVERLLATRRVAPSSPDWQPRVIALGRARRDGPPEMIEAVQAEIAAMWRDRDAWLERLRTKTFGERYVDWDRMLECAYRHPLVRGLTATECRKRRQCFLCAGPVAGRRRHWCSDRCIRLWFQNHEWTSVVDAARRRDRGCVRGENHPGPYECNHKRPRRGRGYHAGCHHHLNRVEMLCHHCHVAETTRQGRERRAQVSPILSTK